MAHRLPPYARELRARLSADLSPWSGTSLNGNHPTVFLLTGSEAWSVAQQWRNHRLLTLLPPGDDPSRYDWRLLVGADPLLLWRCGRTDGDEVLHLLKAVMGCGIGRVLDVASQIRYVRTEVRRDAA